VSPLSLKWRISLLVAAVLTLVVAILSVGAYVELREALLKVAPTSLHHVEHEMREFLKLLLIEGACTVIGGTVLATLIVLWGLRPIRRTADRLRGVTDRNLGRERLEDVRAPSELGPFIASVSEMLGRLNQVLERQRQFTADASHELRTPLALAKSTLQAARTRERDPAEYRRAIDETLGDLDRMERLMRQLLVLARMDESDRAPEAADVSLDAVLARVAADGGAAAVQAGSRVVLEAAPPLHVRGNEEQLVQLFGNLVENAVVHGPPGGTVRVALAHEGDGRCTACIHDDGGAIPAEALPRLFDRFYRADASRTRARGGAGLGLAIAREIARRHDGDIEIASDPSSGTNVRVRLPCV
jgi:two-component system heavy metal sensor histidine kinase CusS